MTWASEAHQRSAHDFEHVVWPVVGPLLGGGTLLAGEGRDDPLARLCDLTSSIDWWQRVPTGMRGISSRVQWDENFERQYRTLTVRTRKGGHPTELDRLVRDPAGAVRPYLQVHAYVREGGLRAAAAVPWAVLAMVVADMLAGGAREVANRQDADTWFLPVPWSVIPAADLVLYQDAELSPRAAAAVAACRAWLATAEGRAWLAWRNEVRAGRGQERLL